MPSGEVPILYHSSPNKGREKGRAKFPFCRELCGGLRVEATPGTHLFDPVELPLAPAMRQAERLVMDERGSLSARLRSGPELVIGRADVAGKLQRFGALYRAELAGRAARLQRLDLRYEHGVSVAWRDVETRVASGGE